MNWSVRLTEGEEFDCEEEPTEITTLRAVLVLHEDGTEDDDGCNGQLCGEVDVTIYKNATASLEEFAKYNTIAQAGCVWDLSRESLSFLHASTFKHGQMREEWAARLGRADTVIILSSLRVNKKNRNLGGATYLLRAVQAMLPFPALWVTTTLDTNKAAFRVLVKAGFQKSITKKNEHSDPVSLLYSAKSIDIDEVHASDLAAKGQPLKTDTTKTNCADNEFIEFCNAHISEDGSSRRIFLNIIMGLYKAWCKTNKHSKTIKNQDQLARKLKALGFEVVNCKNRRILKNCDLKEKDQQIL